MSQVHSYIVATVNQLINDKTKQIWETLMAQMKQISNKLHAEMDSKRI